MLNHPHSFGGGCADMELMFDLGIAALWHALTNAAQKPTPHQ